LLVERGKSGFKGPGRARLRGPSGRRRRLQEGEALGMKEVEVRINGRAPAESRPSGASPPQAWRSQPSRTSRPSPTTAAGRPRDVASDLTRSSPKPSRLRRAPHRSQSPPLGNNPGGQ
jgi:hypothetical protein